MYDIYVVMSGDTLDGIASKYNVPVDIIKEFNGYMIDLIPGTKLLIPKMNSKYFNYYIIRKGDTLSKIANDNKISVTLLASLNGLNIDDYIYPNQILLVPQAGTNMYFTKIGDTLTDVSKIFKVITIFLIIYYIIERMWPIMGNRNSCSSSSVIKEGGPIINIFQAMDLRSI